MRLLLCVFLLSLTITSTSALSSLRQRQSRWNSHNSRSSSFGGECCDFFTDCYLNDRCSSTCCFIFESSLGMLEEQAVKDGKHTIPQKQHEDPDDGGQGEYYDMALQTKSSKDKHEMTQTHHEDGDDGGADENNGDLSAIEKTSTQAQTRWFGSSFGTWLNNILHQRSNNNNDNQFSGLDRIQKLNMNGGTCCDTYSWCQFGSQCDGTCCWAYENGLGLIETQADSKQQIKAKNLLHAAHKAQAKHEMKMSSKAQHKIASHKRRLQK